MQSFSHSQENSDLHNEKEIIENYNSELLYYVLSRIILNHYNPKSFGMYNNEFH